MLVSSAPFKGVFPFSYSSIQHGFHSLASHIVDIQPGIHILAQDEGNIGAGVEGVRVIEL